MASTFLIVNGDMVLNETNGQPATVTGKVKARQDFGELLSIEEQSNGFGAGIIGLVGDVAYDAFDVSFRVMENIEGAVNRWIFLLRKQRAVRNDDEIVKRLSFNQAKVDQTDQTRVIFRAAVETREGEEIVRGGAITSISG